MVEVARFSPAYVVNLRNFPKNSDMAFWPLITDQSMLGLIRETLSIFSHLVCLPQPFRR